MFLSHASVFLNGSHLVVADTNEVALCFLLCRTGCTESLLDGLDWDSGQLGHKVSRPYIYNGCGAGLSDRYSD